MIPAQLHTIKQNLNKAFCLSKPKRTNMDAFKANLVKLLRQVDGKQSEENVMKYVQNLLAGTYFAPDSSESENNSSPVCYAHISGLREGFDDPFLTESKPGNTNSKSPADASLYNAKAVNLDLKEALQITKFCIWEVVTNWQKCPQTNTVVLERQIDELVYQLYEITLE